MFVARKTVFLEKEFISKKNSGSKVHLEEIQEPQIPAKDSMEMETDSQEVVESEPIVQEPRRSGRIRHEPERYGFLITNDQSIVLVDQDQPTTYSEAIEDLNSAKWLGAIEAEMQSMYDNQVWTLVDNRKVLRSLNASGFSRSKPIILSKVD